MIRRDYPDRPIVGVLAVVLRAGRVLLVQRVRGSFVGRWGFPGGLQELGETIVAAALRELDEETGITAVARAGLPAFDVIVPDDAGRIEHHWTLVPVVCAWESGEVRASDEVVAWRWLAPDEMPGAGIDLLPDVERLARLALTA